MLPRGVGVIRPSSDRIGIQINTPDGPLEFNVPRRQRHGAGTIEEPPAPGLDADAAPPVSEPRFLDGQAVESAESPSQRFPREFRSAARAFRAHNPTAALFRINRALQARAGDRDLLQLRSLVFFALADDHAAARDAMVVLADGDVWDWPTVRSLYRSGEEYSAQLRALEKRAGAEPKAADRRLLAAYHYLMLGHTDAAKRQFERAAAIDPQNEVARRLARELQAARRNPPPAAGPAAPQQGPSLGPASSRPAAPARKPAGPFQIDLGEPGQAPPAAEPKKSP
jgi:hypothetical protein